MKYFNITRRRVLEAYGMELESVHNKMVSGKKHDTNGM
jgi:hypothetical protein